MKNKGEANSCRNSKNQRQMKESRDTIGHYVPGLAG